MMNLFLLNQGKKIGNYSFKCIKVAEGNIIYSQEYYSQRLVFTVVLHWQVDS